MNIKSLFSDKDNVESLDQGYQLGHFIIESQLGEGGMGAVYLAQDTKLDRKVAIKILVDPDGHESLEKRFENEAKTLASLNHPNIVTVYNYAVENGKRFIVMEYVEGEDLKSVLTSRSFGVGEVITCLKEVVEGLKEAHNNGIIHRDIKPHNIIVTDSGKCKLVDFGISKNYTSHNDDQDLTATDQIVGTVSYLAPEILVGQKPSVQSDIFSLGIVLFEMLEGAHPFTSDTRYKTMDQIRNKKVKLSDGVKNLVPARLTNILYKMIEKLATSRYQSLQELQKDLNEINLSDIPEELLASARPESLIMNEQVVRMKLLSRGFKTREIGMIISLAAQIQEKDLKFSDKTMPLDKANKLAISGDALNRAVDRFQGAKLAVSGESHSFKNRVSKSVSFFEGLDIKKVSVALFSVILVSIGLYYFVKEDPVNHEYSDLASIERAQLANPLKDSKFSFKLQRINTVSGEIYLDKKEVHKVIQTNNTGFKVEKTDSDGVVMGYYDSPMNQFMGPMVVKDLSGKVQRSIFSGDYNSIFPLSVGKKMEYKVSGTDTELGGSYSGAFSCEVKSKTYFHLGSSKIPTFVVGCVNKENSDQQDTYYYSPHLKMIVKSEFQYIVNDEKHLFVQSLEQVNLAQKTKKPAG